MSTRPIYAALAADLIRGIREERYPVGSLLPTEMELASERRVSRSTARAALNHLANLGLVSRQKAVGTRVTTRQAGADYTASTTTLDELVHFGSATERRIQFIQSMVADDRLAPKLDGRPGKRWLQVAATRVDPVDADRPLCWTDSFIDERYADVAPRLRTYSGLIVSLIDEMHGVQIEEVRQTISAITTPDAVAEALFAARGLPALSIKRRYRSLRGDEVISISTYPADRFQYRMSLRRPKRA